MSGNRLIDLTGMQFGRLTVQSRGETRTYPSGHREVCWLVLCECGNSKQVAGARLRNGQTKSCGCYALEVSAENGRRNVGNQHHKDVVGYRAAHHRITRSRGGAATHKCTSCDRGATSWAYMHTDPNELSEPYRGWGKPFVIRYSANPSHYQPMCHACHIRFDKEWRAAS